MHAEVLTWSMCVPNLVLIAPVSFLWQRGQWYTQTHDTQGHRRHWSPYWRTGYTAGVVTITDQLMHAQKKISPIWRPRTRSTLRHVLSPIALYTEPDAQCNQQATVVSRRSTILGAWQRLQLSSVIPNFFKRRACHKVTERSTLLGRAAVCGGGSGGAQLPLSKPPVLTGRVTRSFCLSVWVNSGKPPSRSRLCLWSWVRWP